MKIIVAVKRVIDYNVQVRVKADGTGVEKENVKMSMNPPDENAVEEALRIKEAGNANEVIIISIGDEKSQETIRKENEKMSKFLQQSESELKIALGEPDKTVKNDAGIIFLIYKKKKYNITCERKFEIDRNKMIVGFTSKGCF